MSTALEKSLDDIISSSRKARKVASKQKTGKTTGKTTAAKAVGKVTGKAQKKSAVVAKSGKTAKPTLVKSAAAPAIDLSAATKVVAHGLPMDLKQDVVKSQIGGVKTASLSYNEKGQFKGIATIIFKSAASASLAIEKYHGAPVDGGSRKLRLELVVEPAPKTLASRIAANTPAVDASQKKEKLKKALLEKRKQAQQKKKEVAQKKAAQKPKPKAPKPEKKTLEQLDQEMTDYFNK